MGPPPPIFTLVLVGADRHVLDALPPFEAENLQVARHRSGRACGTSRHSLRVIVLRLLGAERASAHGGAVTYLAQVTLGAALPPLAPWPGSFSYDTLVS